MGLLVEYIQEEEDVDEDVDEEESDDFEEAPVKKGKKSKIVEEDDGDEDDEEVQENNTLINFATLRSVNTASQKKMVDMLRIMKKNICYTIFERVIKNENIFLL